MCFSFFHNGGGAQSPACGSQEAGNGKSASPGHDLSSESVEKERLLGTREICPTRNERPHFVAQTSAMVGSPHKFWSSLKCSLLPARDPMPLTARPENYRLHRIPGSRPPCLGLWSPRSRGCTEILPAGKGIRRKGTMFNVSLI